MELLDATVMLLVPGSVLSKVTLLPDRIEVACVPWFPARSKKSMVKTTVPFPSSESMTFVADHDNLSPLAFVSEAFSPAIVAVGI